jgi:hypothetical protein
VLGRAREVACSLDARQSAFSVSFSFAPNLSATHLPSPLPVGSSSSTPTHTPPRAIAASPANRTVPRRPAPWPWHTSQRAPAIMSAGTEAGGGGACAIGVGTSAKRPSLLALRCACTVSERQRSGHGFRKWTQLTPARLVLVLREFKLVDGVEVRELSRAGVRVRVFDLE